MNPTWLILYLALAVVAAGLSGLAVCWAIRLAPRWGLMDVPDVRKNHPAATPVAGGLALISVFVGLCLVAALVAAWVGHWQPHPEPGSVLGYASNVGQRLGQLFWLLGATLALLILGVWDDKKPLGAVSKLIVQVVIAGAVVWFAEIRLTAFLPDYLSIPLSILWFVTLINALNFLDNMDGLAGGIAAIATGSLTLVGLLQGQIFVPALGALLLGCLLGFLAFNVWPARIFMGDGGSLPVGFLLAALGVLTTYYTPGEPVHAAMPAAVLTPLLILAVPLYDAVTTLWQRWREGRALMHADHSHFSHRLLALGFSQQRTVRIIWLLTGCTGLAAIMLQRLPTAWGGLSFLLVVLVLAVVRMLESRGERQGAGP